MSDSSLYLNSSAKTWTYRYESDIVPVQQFHSKLPTFQKTPLVPLEGLAKQLGVKGIYVKDESNRLNLPAFKILGASWGCFRSIANHTGLSLDSSIETIGAAARENSIILLAATEGNHGRAVARMGKLLGVPVRIYMSKFADSEAVAKIESEGAKVTVTSGTYDDAVAKAFQESECSPNALLIQDNAFEGYEEIPKWIVEGYSTLLVEVEQQLRELGLEATVIVTPIGVGSLGHAVVAHCKSEGRKIAVLTVEPETAACLNHNLKAGEWSTIETTATIMNGMNCGTVSPISWPIFQRGVDASVTISDHECHLQVQYLHAHGVGAGPCGAGGLAAFLKVSGLDGHGLDLDEDSVIVILSTEGSRGYKTPSSHSSAHS